MAIIRTEIAVRITFVSIVFLLFTFTFTLAGYMRYQNTDNIKFATDIEKNDFFGGAVDVDTDYAVVTSLNAAVTKNGDLLGLKKAGAAYIFKNIEGEWEQTAKLVANDAVENDNLGFSAAIDRHTVVVGAWRNSNQDTRNAGAVYVYQKKENDWIQKQKLTSNYPQKNGQFGVSVAIQDDWIVVGEQRWTNGDFGNSGSVSIFHKTAESWELHQRLYPALLYEDTFFGRSVSISNDKLVVGAPSKIKDDEHDSQPGSVYVYQLTRENNWEPQWFFDEYSHANNLYGGVVSLDNETLAVGAWNDDTKGSNSGAVFIYQFDGESWQLDATLTSSKPQVNAKFGIYTSVSGKHITVGSHLFDTGSIVDQGVVNLFERKNNGWVERYVFSPKKLSKEAHFGRSVSIDGDTVLVGAELSNQAKPNAGAAFFYSLTEDINP